MIRAMLQSRPGRRFFRNSFAILGLVFYGGLVLCALFVDFLPLADPYAQDLFASLDSPSPDHPFGRDEFGRDVFSRVLHGTKVSVKTGFSVVGVSVILGTFLGTLAGWFGGWFEELIMRLTDILLAFPGLLLAIAIVAILGPGLDNVIIALCITGWVGYARLARGQVLLVREFDYIQAVVALGAGTGRILLLHVLPAIAAPLLVQATFGIAGAIIGEASLSFLGLGVKAPEPSWGGILNEGVDRMVTGDAFHLMFFPGLAIMLSVLGLNFLGDGLRDALDPKMTIED